MKVLSQTGMTGAVVLAALGVGHSSQDAALQSKQPGAPAESTPATIYAQARTRGLSFSAVADHSEAPSPNVWESTCQMSSAANDSVVDGNGVFFPFWGTSTSTRFPVRTRTPVTECRSVPATATRWGATRVARRTATRTLFSGRFRAPPRSGPHSWIRSPGTRRLPSAWGSIQARIATMPRIRPGRGPTRCSGHGCAPTATGPRPRASRPRH